MELIRDKVGVAIAAIVVIFSLALIGWLVASGSPFNSLHESALSWAFTTVLGVLAGLGVGKIVERFPVKGSS